MQQVKINILKMEITKIETDFRKYCEGKEINWYDSSWPEKEELKLFLKDLLEPEVDKKYYLNENQANKIIIPNTSFCIDSNYYKGTNVKGYETKNRRQLIIKNATDKGYLEAYEGDGINLEQPNSETRRGRVQEQIVPTLQCNDMRGVIVNPLQISSTQAHNTITRSGVNNCLPSAMGMGGGHTPMVEDLNQENLTIRKLTPKECFRLMGFLEDEINLTGLSDSQRYKLAGNGWDINLVSKIFKEMFKNGSKDKTN